MDGEGFVPCGGKDFTLFSHCLSLATNSDDILPTQLFVQCVSYHSNDIILGYIIVIKLPRKACVK